MDDLDKFIKNTEDTVEKVRKAIAGYEASADNLDRLRREAMHEMERFEKLRKDKNLKMDWAIDLFMEASELKMAMYEGVDEIEVAVDDLLSTDLDNLLNYDPMDVDNFSDDMKEEFNALSAEEQKQYLADIAEAVKEADKAADKPKAKRRRNRMSI